jgi:hypothetical protein
MVQVIDTDTMKKILDLGGEIGGGWGHIHQHITVNTKNKETIENLLKNKGFVVSPTEDIGHPEFHAHL